MCSAVLTRFEDDGRQQADLALVEWGAKFCLYKTQVALDQILRNFPNKWVGMMLRKVVFPLGCRFKTPNDKPLHHVASLLLQPGDSRDRLTHGLFSSDDVDDVGQQLELAMSAVIAADDVERRLRDQNIVKPYDCGYSQWLDDLLGDELITELEVKLLRNSAELTRKIIMVDDFPGDFLQSCANPATETLARAS